jgi:hypothetical protein
LTVSEHVGAWQVTLHTPLWQSLGAPQFLPFAHVLPGAQMPPQSTSDSVWFFALSEHVGVVQASDVQIVLVQSVPVVQALVGAQRLQDVVPPQSTSLSPWFLTTSEHVGAAQRLPVQTPLVQSPGTRQPAPVPHFPQSEPPQSTPVSPWFFTPSEQVGAAQRLPVQTPFVQSPAVVQPWPVAHFFEGAQEPPQSTPVSVPFFTVSEQVEVWHFFGLPLQTPLPQSAAVLHVLPATHCAQDPPQSMSLSVWFFVASAQVGA